MEATIDLETIRAFVRVSERGSFRRAAEDLHVPPSTISRRVVDLESKLGVRLLQRTTRKVALTDAGAEYLRACQPSLAALEEAARRVSERGAAPSGRLRVSASVTFGERFLGPVLRRYLGRYPDVTVDVLLTDRHVDLLGESVDVAFRAGALPDSTLVARRIGRGHVRCVASPEYLEKHGTPGAPRDLAGHECIVYQPLTPGGRWSFRVGGRTLKVPVHGRVVSNSLPLSLEAALAGLGIARVPEQFSFAHVKKGALVEVLEDYLGPPGTLQLVYPSALHVPARVQAFVDLAMDELRRGPWLP